MALAAAARGSDDSGAMVGSLINRVLFQPDPSVGVPPPGVEERWLRTADGVRLHAWCVWGGDDAPTLIWSHGNGVNIAGRADVLRQLAARGLNVVAYDYRGYGKSSGRPTEEGVYLDAAAAYDDARGRGVSAQRVIAFGESLGGAVSIALAATHPCAGVAVVSTFTSLRDIARAHVGPLALFAGEGFNSVERVRGLAVPIFIAHGDQDEIVPYELGKRLFAEARPPKRFLPVRGAHHNDVFAAADLLDAIAVFARRATTRRSDGAGMP